MRIRRIEIANFRKLAEPVVIDTIEPRLTVIAGQNEEGKSTVTGTGRPRKGSEYDRVLKDEESARDELDVAAERLRAYEDKVEELGRLGSRLTRHVRDY